jgi:hypothetical protein
VATVGDVRIEVAIEALEPLRVEPRLQRLDLGRQRRDRRHAASSTCTRDRIGRAD